MTDDFDSWLDAYDKSEALAVEKSKGNMPPTIKNHDLFLKSPALGFDGVSDWRWYMSAFHPSKVTPMDIDGITERNGQFLIVETKDVGVEISKGQRLNLEALYDLGVFTVIMTEGKHYPEKVKVWAAPNFMDFKMDDHAPVTDIAKLQTFIGTWWKFAYTKYTRYRS